jgi:uncharacterized damage-inducible protein DinB
MTRHLLADGFDHHIWATLTLLDACAALDLSQLETTAQGTYGSIMSTLRHLVAADRGYLTLLSNDAVARISDEQEGALTLADMRAVMEENAAVWPSAWGATRDPARDPDEIIVRHREDGSSSSAPFGIRLNQVLQHGTDHRSQVCTQLTTLGMEPPEIDVWAYAWSKGWLTETEAPAGA